MHRVTKYFDELEEVRTEYAKKAIEKHYYGILTWATMDNDFGPKRRYWTVALIAFNYASLIIIGTTIGYTSYLLRDEFDVATGAANYAFLGILSAMFIFLTHKNRKLFYRMHENIGRGSFEYSEPHIMIEDWEEFQKSLRQQRLVLAGFVYFVIALTMLAIMAPMIDNQLGLGYPTPYDENGINRQLPVPIYLPFDASTTIGHFLSLAVLAMTFSASGYVIGGTILVFSTITIFISTEIKQLICSVKTLYPRATRLYCKRYKTDVNTTNQEILLQIDEYQNCIHECLTENIKHHNQIIENVDIFNHLGRYHAFATATIVGLAIGLTMMQINSGVTKIASAVSFSLVALAELLTIVLLGSYGENLATLSEELRCELYFLPWYEFNIRNRKHLIFFQLGASKPLVFVGWIIKFDMEMISSVFQSAYSLFNFLNLSKA